jgi:signal peptidase II
MTKLKTLGLLKIILILTVVMANIGCDQVSKHIVRERISSAENISLLYNHFHLMKVENTGAFLSLGDNIPAPVKFVLLTLLPLLVLLVALGFLIYKKGIEKIPLVAACFIVGGGIGNVYDRLLHHSVTDFMHIGFGIFQTGIFNMADVSVSVGVIVFLGYYYWQGRIGSKLKTEA